jgi:phosphoenolpyruvate synthase/pyruvate phosphate dikinase
MGVDAQALLVGNRSDVFDDAAIDIDNREVQVFLSAQLARQERHGERHHVVVAQNQYTSAEKGAAFVHIQVPGGTKEVSVPRFLRSQPTLSEEQLRTMARLAISLEQKMGWPVDMESAYVGDERICCSVD